jgi:acyl-CoA dehydrogenase
VAILAPVSNSAADSVRTMVFRYVQTGEGLNLRGRGTTTVGADLKARAEAVAKIAASTASAVDRNACFPSETFAAARSERILGLMVPPDLGGEGASIGDIVDVCYMLGRACSSSGLIYAMHQTKVACILRHGRGAEWHERVLRRMASSTTEGQSGGNIRSSAAAIGHDASRIVLDRAATVISYGEHADGIVTTARRAADAANTDQVLCVFLKDDYSLERVLEWDTLGMRGTCSAGFRFKADGERAQILPEPYEKIHAQTMMPVAHLMWSGTWTGIASDAVERARLFVRNAARRSDGQLPPGASHLTQAIAKLRTLRSLVGLAIERFETILYDQHALEAGAFQTSMNLLKVNASETAVSTVMSAMQATGLAGYRNDSEFSIGRHLRDILSSPIMINNERILANIGTAALLTATPATLRDQDEANASKRE